MSTHEIRRRIINNPEKIDLTNEKKNMLDWGHLNIEVQIYNVLALLVAVEESRKEHVRQHIQ